MRIPADALIASEKFTSYLLVPQTRSDKSRYLARAGYTLENVERLIDDLRRQILPLDATLSRSTRFGNTYVIDGPLVGPNGERIHIRTVWLEHPLSGSAHFVTLIPQPRLNE
jgi:hypothetical protein